MSTTVHCLNGTSYPSPALTVGELKKTHERKHGVAADTQTVWACSTNLELDDTTTLAGEAEVQLLIDRQPVTVLFEEDPPYEVECRHNSKVDDVRKTLEDTHGMTNLALVLDANAYDAKGFISPGMLVPKESPAHEYLERPLRMVRIHIRQNTTSVSYVDLGKRKLIVQMPWLRTVQGIVQGIAYSRVMTLQLDRARPDVAAFITLLTMIEESLSVASDATLRLHVPEQCCGFWKCHVRNDDTGEDIKEDPSYVLTGPHYVCGIIQCTDVWNCDGLLLATWVAKSLKYRHALPDAATVPSRIE